MDGQKKAPDEEKVVAMLEQAVALIKKLGSSVSFVELCREIDGLDGGEWAYSHGLTTDARVHVIMWQGLTDEGHETIKRLCADPRVDWNPCGTFPYFVDGAVLPYPILDIETARGEKEPPEDGYCWLPVTFRPRDAA
ncbi:hypothetical protein [Roseicyclus sp.]|uniref:hypothetical protein n=1 Tax=Roseicyclus sp. TaxID=1914329 RepID=UPI003FA0C802